MMRRATQPDVRAAATAVVARLQDAGFIAYWAGGCVRDMLLGQVPKDYDIATNAVPGRVEELFEHSVAVGKSFGVVRVAVEGEWFEVATFRRDLGYADGRRPDAVCFVDPETDAQRRDFTINALFYDPVADAIHDFVDGRHDLDAGVVRCVGDPRERFAEDHLRMLRAVRFASVLAFRIDGGTEQAICELAPRVTRISPERIGEEVARLLTESPQAGDAVRMLDRVQLLKEILPEIKALQGQAQPEEFHPEGDVFEHTVAMLNLMEHPSRQLAFAVLLHDVGKPATARHAADRIRFDGHAAEGAAITERVLRRLRFSNNDVAAVVRCIHDHMRFIDVQRMRSGTLRRLIGRPTYALEVELHRLDCLASHGKLDNYAHLRDVERRMANEPVLPDPWVTGHDLLKMGLREGPRIGRWLKRAYDAQLNGEVASREELLQWLARKVRATRSS